jgi:uncharacterized protein (TIGR00369 family)
MSEARHHLDRALAAMPYARHLGIEASLEDGGLISALPYRPDLIGNASIPALHGGVIGAFLEFSAALQLCVVRETAKPPLTIGVTVEYLRPGRAKTLYARASIKRLGRRIANVHVEAWQDEKGTPVALLQGRFMLAAPEPSS